MDREAEDDLSSRSLQDVTLVTVADLERSDPRVMTARQNRTLVEFVLYLQIISLPIRLRQPYGR